MNKILLGLLAGVAIGILLAPDKGSETVKKLRSRINDYKDELEDHINEWSGKASDAINKGKNKINESLD